MEFTGIRQSVDTLQLKLRPLMEQDEALYCSLFTDADVMRYIGPAMSSLQAVATFRRHFNGTKKMSRRLTLMTISEKRSGHAIGICSIHRLPPPQSSIEAGLMLQAENRDRGFAKEAFAATIELAFAATGADEVIARIAHVHRAARGVLTSLGFSPRDPSLGVPCESTRKTWFVSRQAWSTSTLSTTRRYRCQMSLSS